MKPKGSSNGNAPPWANSRGVGEPAVTLTRHRSWIHAEDPTPARRASKAAFLASNSTFVRRNLRRQIRNRMCCKLLPEASHAGDGGGGQRTKQMTETRPLLASPARRVLRCSRRKA